jgi:preprotein translocase subunit SecF
MEYFKHRALLIIPIGLLLASLIYLGYLVTDNRINYDIDLKGGLQIVISLDQMPNVAKIEELLKPYNPTVRLSQDISGYSLIIQADEHTNYEEILSTLREHGYNFSNWSVQTLSASLGTSFLQQAQWVLVFAFLAMGVTVYYLFRVPMPSFYVILCGVADIIEAFVFSQIFGVPLSLATFVGLLLLIGYSVDTDILLTTKVLKDKSGSKSERIFRAMKTGLTMSMTSLCAVVALFFLSASPTIMHLTLILMIGLICDMLNTWITNVILIHWYTEKKGLV